MAHSLSHTPERLPTGIEGLDKVLKGGLVRGSAYILEGPPGAGKTTLANQICFFCAATGRKALYFSLFSESHDRMLHHMRGLRFFDEAAVPDRIQYLSAYSALRDEGIDGLLRVIVEAIRSYRSDLLVLDGLAAAQDAAHGEPELRKFVYELQGHTANTGCTSLVLTNHGRGPASAAHTMVDGWIELLDEMRGPRAVRNVIVRKQRGGDFIRGRHQFRITSTGLRVFPRLEALLPREPASSDSSARVATGIPSFDRMTGGGYPSGSATILVGPSGTGKTTMGLQFLSESTPEFPGLLFGFYETPARVRTKGRSIGVDVDGLVASGALEILWQPPSENLPDELGERLLEAVERRKVCRVFFDGISALRPSFIFPVRLGAYINAVNNTLKDRDATVVYSMEVPELFMPAQMVVEDLSGMVDNVVLMHYARHPDRIGRELLILKIRDSDFDAFPEEYHITDRGVAFGANTNPTRRPGVAGPGPSGE